MTVAESNVSLTQAACQLHWLAALVYLISGRTWDPAAALSQPAPQYPAAARPAEGRGRRTQLSAQLARSKAQLARRTANSRAEQSTAQHSVVQYSRLWAAGAVRLLAPSPPSHTAVWNADVGGSRCA